jgi:hypothetical protein
MPAARKIHLLPDHPDLFELPVSIATLALPTVQEAFTAPIRWDEDTEVKTSKGTRKRRFGSFSAARRMLDCEPEKLRAILRTGLIYAYKGTDAAKSWWVIDLAGIYLYRENQRRRAIGLQPAADWAAYSAHMAALNAKDAATTTGPPPVGKTTADGM